MRQECICISERTLMFCIGGQLFEQAPNRQPRKPEIIMQKVRDAFRKGAYNDNEYYTLLVPKKELTKYIKDLLFSIPEFVELNLSQNEFEQGILVDDESRGKYSFTSRYDVYNSESWKGDFIDLDAFIGNVIGNIYMVNDHDIDCFCCEKEKTEECNTCTINNNYSIKYKCSREPKGEFTFACSYDCYKSKYICCEECKAKDTCEKKCDSNSKDCGLAINKIEKK